jgi:hypothetical protein
MKKALLLAFLCASSAFGADVLIGSFGGLNTADNPAVLADSDSQDLLNVNITPGGKSVYKRPGYGLHKTLTFSTSAIHGAHYFQDVAGSDIQLWGSDSYLNAIVNGGSPVQLATGTVNATWQCADSQGYAYCLTSSRDTCVRTAGTAGTTSFSTTVPLGTMLTFTPDRMVVSGVSGTESALYFSKTNTPTNHTIGVLDPDAFVEYINSPGSRITHVKYACGKLLWWKDQSFGYSVGTTQYDLENVTISANIGTYDNSSDEYNGHVYFRGNDNHIYDYDCSNVTRLSRSITPTVLSANRRKSNSWTLNSQTDWNTGTFYPAVNFSTYVSVGDVSLSSFTANDTSSTTFLQGTGSNITFSPGSIQLSTNAAGSINDPGMEGTMADNYQGTSYWKFETCDKVCGAGGHGGSQFALNWNNGNCGGTCGGSCANDYPILTGWEFRIYDAITNSVIATQSLPFSQSCTWSLQTISYPSLAGRRVRYNWHYFYGAGANIMSTNATYIYPGSVSFYARCPDLSGLSMWCEIDDVQSGSSTITTGNFTSKIFDTGITSATVQVRANWTVNTSTPYIEVQTASNSVTGPWVRITTSSGTNATANRYVRYVSSLSISSTESAVTTIDDVTVVARSTGGVYFTAVNTASNLASWDVFSANDQTGGGSLTYYTRAATNTFTVNSTTPAWVAQSKNATVTASTGAYMQARVDFTATAATSTLALNDLSFNWFEGAASDKAYIKYWNDYVWVAVSSGTAGTNNRILRWDNLNQTWLFDDIASNGFLVQNNNLYIGSPVSGKVYKYGEVTTDDSLPINSYWRSKNFFGANPFLKNTYETIDVIAKTQPLTTLSLGYDVGTSSSPTFSHNLTESSGTVKVINRNINNPIGSYINMTVGDYSSNPGWEVLGIHAGYTPLPWRPAN